MKQFGHFGQNGKVGNFASGKSWEPCSFGWEMVGNLLISKVWESCDSEYEGHPKSIQMIYYKQNILCFRKHVHL